MNLQFVWLIAVVATEESRILEHVICRGNDRGLCLQLLAANAYF